MAKKDKFYMPTGSGGLVRYAEEGKELIKLKPMWVLIASAAIVEVELIIQSAYLGVLLFFFIFLGFFLWIRPKKNE
jgi:preprotein translocase subunit Sec61beta